MHRLAVGSPDRRVFVAIWWQSVQSIFWSMCSLWLKLMGCCCAVRAHVAAANTNTRSLAFALGIFLNDRPNGGIFLSQTPGRHTGQSMLPGQFDLFSDAPGILHPNRVHGSLPHDAEPRRACIRVPMKLAAAPRNIEKACP